MQTTATRTPAAERPHARRATPRRRAWELPVALEPTSDLPLYLQIAQAIVADVRRGRLRPGDPLPGSRTLAHSLGVHRNTVLGAYSELAAEGWVTTEVAGGTFVAREPPAPETATGPIRSAVAPEVGYPLKPPLPYPMPPVYAHPAGMLRMARGIPDVRLLPVTALARAYRRVVTGAGRNLLSYGDPRGDERLRAALARMLAAERGISASPDDILVTRGSQMGLDLAARALLVPGDVVAVEALGQPACWNAFRLAGARLVPLPVDDAGLSVDALAGLAAAQPVKAVYVTPHNQFPTMAVMTAERRRALLALATRHHFAVVEDDYNHQFQYDAAPLLPLASTDTHGVVVYVSSLSKTLAPGLRTGFVVAPPPLLERLAVLRVAIDFQGDLAVERTIAELFETGEFDRHVRRLRRAYHARRDALVAALRETLGDALHFEVPSGGMALWATVAPDVDADEWALRGLSHGVAIRGARMYDFRGEYQPHLRLGFSYHDEGSWPRPSAVWRRPWRLSAAHGSGAARPLTAPARRELLPSSGIATARLRSTPPRPAR